MRKLTITQQLSAKSMATEIALLALLREKRGDVAFWNSLDKLMQVVIALPDLRESADQGIRQQAEAAQDFLDTWRQIAGTNPNEPAPPGSGPFHPPAGG